MGVHPVDAVLLERAGREHLSAAYAELFYGVGGPCLQLDGDLVLAGSGVALNICELSSLAVLLEDVVDLAYSLGVERGIIVELYAFLELKYDSRLLGDSQER